MQKKFDRLIPQQRATVQLSGRPPLQHQARTEGLSSHRDSSWKLVLVSTHVGINMQRGGALKNACSFQALHDYVMKIALHALQQTLTLTELR